jgi:hypothetical protein
MTYLFVFFLLILLLLIPANGKILKISDKNTVSNNNSELFANLYVRETGGTWEDGAFSVDVGTMLEFKVTVETQRDYVVIAILVTLPVNGNYPVFNYDWGLLGLGSSEPKPIFPIGEWSASNTEVTWAWFIVDTSWSKEMTFNAKIVRSGSNSVDLKVVAVKDVQGNYDECLDSISITGERSRITNSYFYAKLYKYIIHLYK